MKARWTKRRQLQTLLSEQTGCELQHRGWPCGRCFFTLRLPGTDTEVQAMWHATLVLRGDYRPDDHGIDMPDVRLSATVDRLLQALRRRVQ
jgi:hypothetical protein